MDLESCTKVCLGLGVATIIWFVYESIWRLYFSPICKFPGPKLAAWTLWYEFYYDVVRDGGGQYIWEIEKMHRKYGPIVRINPYELHVNDPEFYEELYAGGNRERDKYPWQISSGGSAYAMGFTEKHHHHRLRREALNPYFSKRNIYRLEQRIQASVGKLCLVFEEYRRSKKPLNLTVAYLALSLDIITAYSFGRSSGLLDKELSLKWKDTITNIMKNTSLTNHFWWLPQIIEMMPTILSQKLFDFSVLVNLKKDIQAQVQSRLVLGEKSQYSSESAGAHQTSIFDELYNSSKLPECEKSVERLTDEATILVIAGSESPAKTLALIHFHLMQNHRILNKLKDEIRDSMGIYNEIPPLAKLENIPYLSAVVKEGLRLHGGITARSSRIAPKETLPYKQWKIPAGTPISISSVFIHRNPSIFPNPREFRPERWLEQSPIPESLEHYLVAFGKGTRDCIGRNLGLAEIYIALAHVVMRFDIELFDSSISDVEMTRDWYVPQPVLGSAGVQAKIIDGEAGHIRAVHHAC